MYVCLGYLSSIKNCDRYLLSNHNVFQTINERSIYTRKKCGVVLSVCEVPSSQLFTRKSGPSRLISFRRVLTYRCWVSLYLTLNSIKGHFVSFISIQVIRLDNNSPIFITFLTVFCADPMLGNLVTSSLLVTRRVNF